MRHLKFFELFRKLNDKEAVNFHKYLKRLHGNDGVVLDVFGYVKKLHPDFRDARKLDMEYMYRKIFRADINENDYNRIKLLNALSDLYLWLKAFLLSEKANADSFTSQLLWLTILEKRGLETEFSKKASQLLTDLENLPRKNVRDYLKCSAAHDIIYHHTLQNVFAPENNTLLQCATNLDLYYAVAKLKLVCEAVNLKNVNQQNLSPGALLEVPVITDASVLADHPLLLLYQELYQLLSTRRDENYTRLEKILTEQAGKIDPNELFIILSYLGNYSASQVRKGEEQYWARTHQLNKLGVEYGAFNQKGRLSTTRFHNIVNTASKVKEFDWAESFVATQVRHLPADFRDDAIRLAQAIILFEQKKFEKILQSLGDANFKDLHLMLRLKTMILRCYFELKKDQDIILTYCLHFENALRRPPKPRTEAVEATFNFMRLIKMLVRKKAAKNIVLQEIENATPVFFKPWLVEKAAKYKAEFATRKQGK